MSIFIFYHDKESVSKMELELHNELCHKTKKYYCEVCEKEFSDLYEVNRHNEKEHSVNNRRNDTNWAWSLQERRNNGFCVYWNRDGCSYGDLCKFTHEESPECRYQDRCNRKESCKFFHFQASNSFLGQSKFRQTRN